MPDRSPDSSGSERRDLVAEFQNSSSDVASLLGDLYRGEVDRATAWRSRLDQTTNWAVVVVAAILTWAFSSQNNPHYVLLIGMLAVTAFLLIEAHRFREYDIWRSRVRTLQRNLFVGFLTPESVQGDEWRVGLSESLVTPKFTMPFRKAVGHRLRRMYLALLILLLTAWVVRVTVFAPGEPWQQTAAIPGLAGEIIVAVVAAYYLGVGILTIWSAQGTEIREDHE